MTPDQSKRLQANLGVAADGIIGAGTLRALFERMGAKTGLAVELGVASNVHFRTYGILENPARLAHFMGQCAHESGGFVFMEEIWGPTAAQRGYEGRKDLGNTVAGDGFRYKGRGPIQLTGRANYRKYGRDIGIDLEGHPEIAAVPSIGILTACKYWCDHGCNELADRDDLEGITRRINGGVNGLADRKARTAKAKGLVG